MKKVWFGLGAIVIAILLLLATRFVQFKEVQDNGHACLDNGVASMLMRAVDEENIALELPMYSFNALDIIFKRGNSYYMGVSKKEKIDLAYPLYIDEGVAIEFVENKGKLYNNEYNEVEVYEGLVVNDGISYNPGGDRADACTFLFYEVGNGTFINTQALEYMDRADQRQIPLNSIIYFSRDHMTYYIYNQGNLEYRCAPILTDDSKFFIDGNEVSYYDLLLKLGVIYEPVKKDKNNNNKVNEDPEEITESAPATEETPAPTEKPERTKPDRTPSEPNRGDRTPSQGGQAKPPAAPVAPDDGDAPAKPAPQPGNKVPPQEGSAGVRPDSMRPDKTTDSADAEDDREPVFNYVKPEAKVYDLDAGVYWIKIPVEVSDPAHRLHPNRRVQIEIYEINPKNGRETLVQRTFTGSSRLDGPSGDRRLVVGDGAIKPGTKYRVNAYFTYFNEYDETIVENITIDNPYVVTGVLPDGAAVCFHDYYPDDDTKSSNIDFYYDDRLELSKVSIDAEATNEDALYGIKRNGGLVLNIKGLSPNVAGVNLDIDVEGAVIAEIKKGNLTSIISPGVLRADASYEYTLKAVDFFDNKINLINNTGKFNTCKGRPKASITLIDKKIGLTSLNLNVTDVNSSALFYGSDATKKDNSDSSKTNTDLYLIVSSVPNNSKNPFTLEDIEYYLANGKRDKANDSPIYYAIKIPRENLENGTKGYSGQGGEGITIKDLQIDVPGLPLDSHFFAYVMGDYDLGNGAGPVYFSPLGDFGFNSATIDTLGYAYVTTEIYNVTSSDADIYYSLNTSRTNEDLISLLTSADFKIVSTGGADEKQYSHMEIDASSIEAFKSGNKMHMNPQDYFADKSDDLCSLDSATDYKIMPEIIATYDEIEYSIKVVLSADTFKTMRKPVEVNMKDLLLAAGTMRFDVNIYDKDDAITGTSSSSAVMSVYTADGILAKVMKVKKSHVDDEYTSIELTGLDTGTDYIVRFSAVEYNEGYSAATFESNKLLAEFNIAETVDLSGIIKLEDLQYASDGNMTATIKAEFRDPDFIMCSIGYYINVSRNGQDVTYKYDPNKSGFEPMPFEDHGGKDKDFRVKRYTDYNVVENSTYDMELYVIINNQKLTIDTLTFETDEIVIPIHNEYEFIYEVKAHSGKGKYLICEDLSFNSNYRYTKDEPHGFNPKSDETSDELKELTAYLIPKRIGTMTANDKEIAGLASKPDYYFDGKIDGQGYKFGYNVTEDGCAMFGSIGNHAEIYDMDFRFSMNNQTQRVADEGFLCVDNFGYIHDIFVTYEGGVVKENYASGLLCRYNTISGRIENFVVKNTHTEENSQFSAYYAAGLLGWYNYGTVKNGYVYGDDIIADVVTKSTVPNLRIAGVFGGQGTVGVMSNVFSMVNVIAPDPSKISGKVPYRYGNLLGEANGKVSNAYGIGESYYNSGAGTNTKIGPLFGTDSAVETSTAAVKTVNVFTWYESGNIYTNANLASKQTRVETTTLCDTGWQRGVLGAQFDASLAEVGYYPQVKLSKELPKQDYIPLPNRELKTIDLISADVDRYLYEEIEIDALNEDGTHKTALVERAALVKVRVYNPKNALIEGVTIENLSTKIIDGTTSSEDGYTTFDLLVYNPSDFVNSYAITHIKATLNNKSSSFPVSGNLRASFYLPVSTPAEWNANVVKQPTKNSRIVCDIDFSGIKEADICAPTDYYGYINGSRLVEVPGSKRIEGYISEVENTSYEKGYALQNITLSSSKKYVFTNLRGDINNLSIENFTSGTAAKPASSPAFIANTYDGCELNNIHMTGVKLVGYSNVAGLVGYARDASIIKNCSVQDLDILYKETNNSNTTGYIGGIVGNLSSSRINNCFVRNININVNDIQCCEGAGGVVGYGYYSNIESVYAEGDIVVRGSNVGGCVGSYYGNKERSSMKNMIAKVNVNSYQDCIGGLIGYTQVDEMLSADTNMSGVAFGNVFSYNTDSEDVSYAVGAIMGAVQHFYGTEEQLLNGMIGQPKDENTYGLITLDEMKKPATYTGKITMSNDYDYSYVENLYLPHLYYEETSIELPGQEEEISMITDCVSKNAINVKQIYVNPEPQRTIWIDFINPNGYKVTKIVVEDELLLEDHLVIDNDNTGRAEIMYLGEQNQKHWKDSYVLLGIEYEDQNGTKGYSDFTEQPVRIPLTLYKDIYNINDWSNYISPDNGYGNYENYRVRADIDFAGKNYTKNAKLGRLVGDYTQGKEGRATLSNIAINEKNTSLIFRLNSELSRINFKDCSLKTSGRSVIGIIGTSSGRVDLVDFEKVYIEDSTDSNISSVGLIGSQVGGRVTRVKVNDCEVTTYAYQRKNRYWAYVGGLVGYSRSNALFKEIEVKNTTVLGTEYVGGVVGYATKSNFNDILVEDCDVTANWRYVGGVVGYDASGRVTKGNIPYFTNITVKGTPIVDGSGNVIDYKMKVNLNTENLYTNSTSEIGQWVGGAAGRLNGYRNGWNTSTSDNLAKPSILVDGVVVTGYGNNLGGAFGYTYDLSNTTVKNTIIRNEPASGVPYLADQCNIGGVVGRCTYDQYYNRAENVLIDVKNADRIGGIYGWREGSTARYCEVNECTIKADKDPGYTANDVGGLVGRTEGHIYYGIVYNTVIDAPNSDNVGGVVGYGNGYVYSDVYYGNPKKSNKAYASSEYYVKGHDNVGGLVGWVARDKGIRSSYTNANAEGHYYVGGLVGAYDNVYNKPASALNYSSCFMYYSYAAGTVKAEDYAGGLIGQTTMATATEGYVLAKHKEQGGRSVEADQSGGTKSGGYNEYDRTYMNMIFVDSITTTVGDNAYLFSGTTNGFEGMPNAYTSKSSGHVWNARSTYVWNGIKINGNHPDNRETLRWKDNTTNGYRSDYNVRYLTTSDMNTADYIGRIYRNLNWYRQNPATANTCVAYYQRLFGGERLTTDAEWAEMGDAVQYRRNVSTGESGFYLPHVRANESTNPLGDWLTRRQSQLGIKLIIPEEDAAPVVTSINMSEEPEAHIYISGVDTINVEFSENLVGTGYYRLNYMDLTTNETELIEEGEITERVMTYETDMNGYISLEYGYERVDGENEGYKVEFSTYAESKKVMVYGDKYYTVYYNEDYDEYHLVFGSMSNKLLLAEDLYANGKYTGAANVVKKNFINLYDGKAIADDGTIYGPDGKQIGTASKGLTRCSYAKPLQRYSLEGTVVEVYQCFTQYTNDTVISKDIQQFTGIDGTTAIYSKYLDNVKNTGLIYNKNGKSYNTILANNGMMVELQQRSDDIGAPKEFKNEAIIQMSDNFNTSIPMVIVMYSNTDVMAYNYKTGELILNLSGNNSKAETMSLLDYAGIYFDKPLTSMVMASKAYSPMAEIIDSLNEGNTIESMITGKGNAVGDETAITGDEKDVAGINQGIKDPNKKYEDDDTQKEATSDTDETVGKDTPENGTNSQLSGDSTTEFDSSEKKDSAEKTVTSEGQNETMAKDGLEGDGNMAGDSQANGGSAISGSAIQTEEGALQQDQGTLVEGSGTEATLGQEESDDNSKLDASKSTSSVSTSTEEGELDPASNQIENEDQKDENKSEAKDKDKEALEVVSDNYNHPVAVDNTEESKYRIISYAGTPSEEALGDSSLDGEYIDIDRTEMKTVIMNSNYSMAYNPITGVYELIDMSRFTRYHDYESENQRLNIENIAAAAGYAEKTEEKKKAPGLLLYSILAVLILGGVGFAGYRFRKAKINK